MAGIAISSCPVRKSAEASEAVDLRVCSMTINLGLPTRLRKRPHGMA